MAVTYTSTATGTALISEIRLRGEVKGDASKGPFTDALLLSLLNSAIRKAYGIITRYDRSRQRVTDTSITTVSGTASYSIPSTVADVSVVALASDSASTGYILLNRIDYQDRYRYRFAETAQAESTLYALSDASIYLFPTPTFAKTMLVEGRRHPPTLGVAADDWDGLGVNGWQEFVIGDVLVQCVAKLGQPDTLGRELKAEGLEQMRINAIRDRARPRQISNVIDDSSRYGISGSARQWRY